MSRGEKTQSSSFDTLNILWGRKKGFEPEDEEVAEYGTGGLVLNERLGLVTEIVVWKALRR